jgi:hypothetical protein
MIGPLDVFADSMVLKHALQGTTLSNRHSVAENYFSIWENHCPANPVIRIASARV